MDLCKWTLKAVMLMIHSGPTLGNDPINGQPGVTNWGNGIQMQYWCPFLMEKQPNNIAWQNCSISGRVYHQHKGSLPITMFCRNLY